MRYTTIILLLLLAAGCNYRRVGSLTMVSTRNVDKDKPYEVLLRNVEAKAKTKHDDALQEAIDQAVKQHPGGEYMMNTAVYVKSNGNWVKVTGDVWGLPVGNGVANSVQTGSTDMKMGDRVAFRLNGTMYQGAIVGMRPTTALVEYTKAGKQVMKEVDFTKLTRLQ